MPNEELTKEKFKDIFEDSFKMTNYAIEVAREQIDGGNDELSVKELLEEIKKTPPTSANIEKTAEKIATSE